MTDQEISNVTGIPLNVVNPRRGELEKMGLVVKSIQKEHRWQEWGVWKTSLRQAYSPVDHETALIKRGVIAA